MGVESVESVWVLRVLRVYGCHILLLGGGGRAPHPFLGGGGGGGCNMGVESGREGVIRRWVGIK